jgi:long-chain fatty acid transport protein
MRRKDLARPLRLVTALSSGALATLAALPVLASSGIDVPDSGALQMGRGGAWVARADDPLAAYMNPAAMAYQAHGVHLSTQLLIFNRCFTRVGPDGEPVSPGQTIPGPGADGGPEAATCIDTVYPNPQLAGVFRINDQWAIGLAVLGPHGAGSASWPEEVEYLRNGESRTQPSPNRYILVDQTSVLVYPTISVAFAPIPELSIGAGFIWGIATAEFTTFTETLSPDDGNVDDFARGGSDIKAKLNAADFFVPGFVVGAN